MNKLILDSDGLIKLNKAGILDKLLSVFECLIPKEVYEETIIKGKEELYEDAFELEKILKNRSVDIIEFAFSEDANNTVKGITGLGKGETAVLHLFFRNKDAVILSDDRRFITLLKRHRIPFITPSNVLLYLVEKGTIDPSEGLEKLERLKSYINNTVYEKIKLILLGGK
jgi:rRNA-processing protein FCF1